MKKASLLTAGLAAAMTAGAYAEFTGFSGDSYATDMMGNRLAGTDGAAWAVIDVYATFGGDADPGFDNADATVLNLFNSSVSRAAGGMFSHNDASPATGGTFAPGLSLDIPGFANSAIDSFVTIGGMPGAVNSTALDPNFGEGTGGMVPDGAGWFNQNPPNGQGAVDGELKTFVGRFVISIDDALAGDALNFAADIGYNYGSGTGSFFSAGQGSFAYVPAPGALALLGLGGLAARRRRG